MKVKHKYGRGLGIGTVVSIKGTQATVKWENGKTLLHRVDQLQAR